MTRTEIWNQIANGERPTIVTDYCKDQYATLQKIVRTAGYWSAGMISAASAMQEIQAIIANEIIDICIDHESEKDAFADDTPAPMDDEDDDEYRMKCAVESLQAQADVADEIVRKDIGV